MCCICLWLIVILDLDSQYCFREYSPFTIWHDAKTVHKRDATYISKCIYGKWFESSAILRKTGWNVYHVLKCTYTRSPPSFQHTQYDEENEMGQKRKLLFWIIYYFPFFPSCRWWCASKQTSISGSSLVFVWSWDCSMVRKCSQCDIAFYPRVQRMAKFTEYNVQ